MVVGAGSHEAAVANITLVQLGGGNRGGEEGEEGDEGKETHVDVYVVVGFEFRKWVLESRAW